MKKKNTVAVWASPHKPTVWQYISLQGIYKDIEFLKDTHPKLFTEICDSPSDVPSLKKLATKLCDALKSKAIIQPAGSPAFQHILGAEMVAQYSHKDNPPVLIAYSHSKRVSVDEIQEDGTIKKISIFEHEDWIEI